MTMRFAALAALSLAAPALGQNMLLNAGFEEVSHGSDFSWPVGWDPSIGASSSDVVARTGDWSARVAGVNPLQSWLGQKRYFTDLTEPTAVGPGDAFMFEAYVLNPSFDPTAGTGHAAIVSLIFSNSDPDWIRIVETVVYSGLGDEPLDVWQRAVVTATAPAGAVAVTAVVRVDANDDFAWQGSYFFDDATLTLVPAPGAVALFGFGAVATRRRRQTRPSG